MSNTHKSYKLLSINGIDLKSGASEAWEKLKNKTKKMILQLHLLASWAGHSGWVFLTVPVRDCSLSSHKNITRELQGVQKKTSWEVDNICAFLTLIDINWHELTFMTLIETLIDIEWPELQQLELKELKGLGWRWLESETRTTKGASSDRSLR